jgi:hypothetical protein
MDFAMSEGWLAIGNSAGYLGGAREKMISWILATDPCEIR